MYSTDRLTTYVPSACRSPRNPLGIRAAERCHQIAVQNCKIAAFFYCCLLHRLVSSHLFIEVRNEGRQMAIVCESGFETHFMDVSPMTRGCNLLSRFELLCNLNLTKHHFV
jgi:hypothetical protein